MTLFPRFSNRLSIITKILDRLSIDRRRNRNENASGRRGRRRQSKLIIRLRGHSVKEFLCRANNVKRYVLKSSEWKVYLNWMIFHLIISNEKEREREGRIRLNAKFSTFEMNNTRRDCSIYLEWLQNLKFSNSISLFRYRVMSLWHWCFIPIDNRQYETTSKRKLLSFFNGQPILDRKRVGRGEGGGWGGKAKER